MYSGMRSLAIAAALLLVTGCSDDCSDTPIKIVDSPDGLHSAVLFQRDCGATTGFSTQVSVVPSRQTPLHAGNAFRADDDHGAAALGPWGGSWAQIQWLATDHLLVRYAAKSRIFKRADHVDGVRITYQSIRR
ncbi:hypothetical protein [Novosphingobium sp. 9]|uniref:hypothetical protein n=1 Tax=Novosphingobium sp. 9 TaxID=2025349 RepID=UPI0021B63AF5|nr:hypothetical protein [Novosphingobium sp. 9]